MGKKRTKKYTPRPAYAPPLVACKIYEQEADMQNHMRLEKMRIGQADALDFNWLLDTQAALLLGAHKSGEHSVVKAALIAQDALRGIRERAERTGKFGCTSDEFGTLCVMLEISEEFWPRASAQTLKWAHEALDAARMASKREAELCTK